MKPVEFVLLVKNPAKGQAKRRLASGVGDDHSAALYRAFVLDLLATLGEASILPTISYYPADAAGAVEGWLGPRYRYLAQRGRDHPDSLKCAFEDMFAEGFERVAILASDNPDLPAGYLVQASEALGRGDAVLGPTSDGGYYLIGFRRDALVPEAFHDIEWSTERVFLQTANRIRNAGRSLAVLPAWHDVDTVEDLRALAARARGASFCCSRTMAILQGHPDLLCERDSQQKGVGEGA
jgi:hypothetical protein